MLTPEQAASNLSSTALANCMTAMDMHVSRVTDRTNGNWFEFYDDGSTNGYKTGACHGNLQQTDVALVGTLSPWGRVRYSTYVSSYSKPGYQKPMGRELLTRWYDWLVNRSVFASRIIAPSLEYARDVGFMISGSEPANYVLAICTASRHAGEQAHNVARMFDYVDEFGISEDLAFFLAFGVNTVNKYGSIIWGHNQFSNEMGSTNLSIWMRRDIRKTHKAFRLDGEKTGVNAMWGGGERDGALKSFERYKDKVEVGKVVIPNPFKPVVNPGTSVMTEAFLRSIIPNLKEAFDVQHVNPRSLAA